MADRSKLPEQTITDGGGTQRALGYINHIYADRCEARITLDERHGNRRGGLHGGVISTLLDSALGYAASRAYDDEAAQVVVTLSLNVNFVSATSHQEICAAGWVRRAGRSVCFCEGKVTDGDGTVLATASGVFKKIG
ncbi:MAG: PaaI family thioesterase [Pseudomonadota bacterium]